MNKCENCGAYLDAGERCDCSSNENSASINEQIEICEALGWVAHKTEDGIELNIDSCSGEDFWTPEFSVTDFAHEVYVYAEDFDENDHAEMWVAARQNGVSGVPSVAEILDGARDIKQKLNDLSDALNEKNRSSIREICRDPFARTDRAGLDNIAFYIRDQFSLDVRTQRLIIDLLAATRDGNLPLEQTLDVIAESIGLDAGEIAYIKEQTEPTELEITGATLLSVEEYKKYGDNIPLFGEWWWLRSPGIDWSHAAFVHSDGSVNYCGISVYNDFGCVRPALRIKNLESSKLRIGDKFNINDHTFTIISKDCAICDILIGERRFDKIKNDYKESEIKRYIDKWFVETIGVIKK